MKTTAYIIRNIRYALFAGLVLVLAGCSENEAYETAMCALVDISGTYADQKANVANLIKAGILPAMISGDSLFLVTIDSNSFNEENLKRRVTLDYRPSHANSQKIEFAAGLDEFADSPARSSHTDISGAMMLCSDYLKNTGAGNQLMIVFSDMQEDLQEGLRRSFTEDEFEGIHIAAMNVIKLARDSSDPQVYRDRLQEWERQLTGAGAEQFRVLYEAPQIPELIEAVK